MAFVTETFTFSFITCTFGPQWVGLILLFFGVANSFGCIVLSYLQPYIGRITIFVGGFLVNFFLIISLLLEWIYPNPNHVEWYIIFVIFWGIGDSIWQRAVMGKFLHREQGPLGRHDLSSARDSPTTRSNPGRGVTRNSCQ